MCLNLRRAFFSTMLWFVRQFWVSFLPPNPLWKRCENCSSGFLTASLNTVRCVSIPTALLYALGFVCHFKFLPRADSPSTKTVGEGKEVFLVLASAQAKLLPIPCADKYLMLKDCLFPLWSRGISSWGQALVKQPWQLTAAWTGLRWAARERGQGLGPRGQHLAFFSCTMC